MDEQDFALRLFRIINQTKKLSIATLTIDQACRPPVLYIQLSSGDKFSLTIEETDRKF